METEAKEGGCHRTPWRGPIGGRPKSSRNRMARWPVSVRRGKKISDGMAPAVSEPGFRFGDRKGGKLRAAAKQAPVNLPTWDHSAAISRLFQESGVAECMAMAQADRRGAQKQPPVCEDRKMLAIVTQKGPESGEMRASFRTPSCLERRRQRYITT